MKRVKCSGVIVLLFTILCLPQIYASEPVMVHEPIKSEQDNAFLGLIDLARQFILSKGPAFMTGMSVVQINEIQKEKCPWECCEGEIKYYDQYCNESYYCKKELDKNTLNPFSNQEEKNNCEKVEEKEYADCTYGWICTGRDQSAYRNFDCSFSSITDCRNSCNPLVGKCNEKISEGEGCKAEWTCEGKTKGYRTADCKFLYAEECKDRCYEGRCIPNQCTSRWLCYDDEHKMYKHPDCSVDAPFNCPDRLLCRDGDCVLRSASDGFTCVPGDFCQDNNHAAYLNEDCSITDSVTCPGVCREGKCVPEPKNGECTPKWICKDDKNKMYRNRDCTLDAPIECPSGRYCRDGQCVTNPSIYNCTAGYFCQDNNHAAYLSSHCIVSNPIVCYSGTCRDGKCIPDVPGSTQVQNEIEMCSPGWKCKDSDQKGYQNNDCSWSNLIKCDCGCSKSECICEWDCGEWSDLCIHGKKSRLCHSTCGNEKMTQTKLCEESDTKCTASWICYNDTYKMYRKGDCSTEQLTECRNYCRDGECTDTPFGYTCSPGYFCQDDEHSAYLKRDCSIVNSTRCLTRCPEDKGCVKGFCV